MIYSSHNTLGDDILRRRSRTTRQTYGAPDSVRAADTTNVENFRESPSVGPWQTPEDEDQWETDNDLRHSDITSFPVKVKEPSESNFSSSRLPLKVISEVPHNACNQARETQSLKENIKVISEPHQYQQKADDVSLQTQQWSCATPESFKPRRGSQGLHHGQMALEPENGPDLGYHDSSSESDIDSDSADSLFSDESETADDVPVRDACDGDETDIDTQSAALQAELRGLDQRLDVIGQQRRWREEFGGVALVGEERGVVGLDDTPSPVHAASPSLSHSSSPVVFMPNVQPIFDGTTRQVLNHQRMLNKQQSKQRQLYANRVVKEAQNRARTRAARREEAVDLRSSGKEAASLSASQNAARWNRIKSKNPLGHSASGFHTRELSNSSLMSSSSSIISNASAKPWSGGKGRAQKGGPQAGKTHGSPKWWFQNVTYNQPVAGPVSTGSLNVDGGVAHTSISLFQLLKPEQPKEVTVSLTSLGAGKTPTDARRRSVSHSSNSWARPRTVRTSVSKEEARTPKQPKVEATPKRNEEVEAPPGVDTVDTAGIPVAADEAERAQVGTRKEEEEGGLKGDPPRKSNPLLGDTQLSQMFREASELEQTLASGNLGSTKRASILQHQDQVSLSPLNLETSSGGGLAADGEAVEPPAPPAFEGVVSQGPEHAEDPEPKKDITEEVTGCSGEAGEDGPSAALQGVAAAWPGAPQATSTEASTEGMASPNSAAVTPAPLEREDVQTIVGSQGLEAAASPAVGESPKQDVRDRLRLEMEARLQAKLGSPKTPQARTTVEYAAPEEAESAERLPHELPEQWDCSDTDSEGDITDTETNTDLGSSILPDGSSRGECASPSALASAQAAEAPRTLHAETPTAADGLTAVPAAPAEAFAAQPADRSLPLQAEVAPMTVEQSPVEIFSGDSKEEEATGSAEVRGRREIARSSAHEPPPNSAMEDDLGRADHRSSGAANSPQAKLTEGQQSSERKHLGSEFADAPVSKTEKKKAKKWFGFKRSSKALIPPMPPDWLSSLASCSIGIAGGGQQSARFHGILSTSCCSDDPWKATCRS
ncbi:hypothetical protein CYMTET_45916 [Cymbomonas tetramitiformis]|uniref:Uncharacterized protein n=1 Tax=Cymbomonas tetramitiformis TaxID=36881 RepID=A0AAE0BZ11_9CHLO|nr:hypothetical protein CYMTET_45916 [Cymbomonas tetramitiformis]